MSPLHLLVYFNILVIIVVHWHYSCIGLLIVPFFPLATCIIPSLMCYQDIFAVIVVIQYHYICLIYFSQFNKLFGRLAFSATLANFPMYERNSKWTTPHNPQTKLVFIFICYGAIHVSVVCQIFSCLLLPRNSKKF